MCPRRSENSRVTQFQRRVYDAVSSVPKGYVVTYSALARAIGCESAQAVGQALRRNPYAPDVPCHRVIRSNLSIGGFEGHTSGEEVARKKSLLNSEGVEFDQNGRLLDGRRLYAFS